MLRAEGLDVSAGMEPAEAQYFEDAMLAIEALPHYGAPVYLRLDSFQHVEASGLQITRSPGKNVVYLGCALLIAGVFFMLYLPRRRIWAWLAPGDAGTDIVLGGSSTRDSFDFDQEFGALRDSVARSLGVNQSG